MLDIAPSVTLIVSPGAMFSFTSLMATCLVKGYEEYLTCEVEVVMVAVLVEGVGLVKGLLYTATPSLVVSILSNVFSSAKVSSPIIND